VANSPGFEALIAEFAGLSDQRAQRDFLVDHPVMVANQLFYAIVRNYPAALAYFHAVDQVGGRVIKQGDQVGVSTNPDRYPVGNGPVERLWNQVEKVQISQPFAITQARQPAFANNLSFTYVKALCDHCEKVMQEDRALASRRQRLIVEATESLEPANSLVGDGEAWKMQRAAGHTWIETCGAVLVDFADRRLLDHAKAIGERLVAECRRRDDQEYLPKLLARLGVLHLDPYTATRDMSSAVNYAHSLAVWRARVQDKLGLEAATLPEAQWQMPAPEAALQTAERYLSEAMKLSSGRDRARLSAGLIQGRAARRRLGEVVDQNEIVAIIDENLPLLQPGKDDEYIIRLQTYRRVSGKAAAEAKPPPAPAATPQPDFERLLDGPAAEVAERLGLQTTVDALVQMLSYLLNTGKHAAGLDLIRKFRQQVNAPGVADQQRMLVAQIEMLMVRDSYAATKGATQRRTARLLSSVLESSAKNAETQGLAALDQALALAPDLLANHRDAIGTLRAILSVGAGTNYFNARVARTAAEYYCAALKEALRLRLVTYVLECLQRLQDVAELRDAGATTEMIRGLELLANDVEVIAGTPGARKLQAVYREATTNWMSAREDYCVGFDVMFDLFRLAKGKRFSACLRGKERHDWRKDAEARRRLTEIRSAGGNLGAGAPETDADEYVDPELVLVSESGDHELRRGNDAQQRFENMRREFDDYLARSMVRLAGKDGGSSVAVGELQKALGSKTVLIDYFLGRDSDGPPVLHILCVTRDQTRRFAMSITGLPPGPQVVQQAGYTIPMSPIGMLVHALRAELGRTPGFDRVVSPEGEEMLGKIGVLLINSILPFLNEQWDKGWDHLCIVPHGASHFMPFHLLDPICRDPRWKWIVTYMPSAAILLSRPRPSRRGPARSVTAVGLDFKTAIHPGLRKIGGGPRSALAISKMLRGKALTNSAATESNVLAAMQSSRLLHFFTHGRQFAHAAAFHSLYLYPSKGDEGVLEAYKIAPLDLSGVDVVTLSACESALGRFDVGDNLTGLPASFFLAGVKTIVGTLWPVSSPVAEGFFTEFYEALRRKEGKLQAFARAQRGARARHPEYRDWGAFYFAGRW